MEILSPTLTLPVVAALPGSPVKGDAVVLSGDGLLYVYNGSSWVAAGGSGGWGGNIDGGTPTSAPAVVAVDGGTP